MSDRVSDDLVRSDRTLRRFAIGFAIVEALLIGWALLSGRLS